MRFRALPRKEYRKLLDDHPPTETGQSWNPDTFPPAIIAACSVAPSFTVEQATTIWEEWEEETASGMFLIAYHLNENAGALGFILPESVPMDGFGRNSITAFQEESPTPNS